MTKNEIFERVREYADKNKISYLELCRRAGVSKSSFYRKSDQALRKMLAYCDFS